MQFDPPRLATVKDLPALARLEEICFTSDRLSQRSFRYFLTKSQAEIWVMGDPVCAYGLVLYHRGTSLARIYSLAVHPDARGHGLGRQLLHCMEVSARAHNALFIRLEVADDNHGALALYKSEGYVPIRKLHHYYEDGHDGVRMEKRLLTSLPSKPANLPFYEQTTDFTCGPSAMIMAAQSLDPDFVASQTEELNIWREATTIFMTTGHGGTSPVGLALAAHERGFQARLWLSHMEAPFLQSVRDEKKRAIIELIHQDFMARAAAADITVSEFPRDLNEIQAALDAGEKIILLISTYRLNREKAPHWIWLVSMDEQFAYFNDPDLDQQEYKFQVDSVYIPVPLKDFAKMIKYGSNQYRAAVLIRRPPPAAPPPSAS